MKVIKKKKVLEGVGYDLLTRSVPATSATPIRLWNLPERAIAEIIKIHEGEPSKLAQALATSISPVRRTTEISSNRERVRLSRTLLLTLYTEYFRPFNRLHEAKVTFNSPKNWYFREWENARFDTSTVNLATVVSSGSQGGALTLPFGQGTSSGSSAGVEVSNSEEVTQELNIAVPTVVSSTINERVILRLKSPFPQINITGNYTATLSMEAIDQYFLYTLEFGDRSSDYSITPRRDYFYQEISLDLRSEIFNMGVGFEYQKRSVTGKKGRKSIKEDDDNAKYGVFKGCANVDCRNQINFRSLTNAPGIILYAVEYEEPESQGTYKPFKVTIDRFNDHTPDEKVDNICLLFRSARNARLYKDWIKGKEFKKGNINPRIGRFDFESGGKNKFAYFGPIGDKITTRVTRRKIDTVIKRTDSKEYISYKANESALEQCLILM